MEKENEIVYPQIVFVEGVLLANGEVIHNGQVLGRVQGEQLRQFEAGATKIARGNEIVVALGDNVA